jgi:hypothetical protein
VHDGDGRPPETASAADVDEARAASAG